jgi:hypothetical protein
MYWFTSRFLETLLPMVGSVVVAITFTTSGLWASSITYTQSTDGFNFAYSYGTPPPLEDYDLIFVFPAAGSNVTSVTWTVTDYEAADQGINDESAAYGETYSYTDTEAISSPQLGGVDITETQLVSGTVGFERGNISEGSAPVGTTIEGSGSAPISEFDSGSYVYVDFDSFFNMTEATSPDGLVFDSDIYITDDMTVSVTYNYATVAAPEPSGLVLSGAGMFGLLLMVVVHRRRGMVAARYKL